MLQGIDRVVIRVPAVAAAVVYYRDVLGMRLVRHEKSLAAFELSGNAELVLHESPDLPEMGVYFRVSDVAEIFKQREQLRLKFPGVPKTSGRGRTAVVKDPFGTVLMLLDRSREQASAGAIDTGSPAAGSLFAGVEPRLSPKRDKLIPIYSKIGRTADDLHYTHHFEALYAEYTAHFERPPNREEVWRHLLNTRKSGKLPKLGDAKSAPPETTDTERNLVKALLGNSLGKRDRLPYTKPFDEFVKAFNSATRRRLTPHQLWRLVAVLAK